MSTETHDARPACTCPSGDGSLQWPCPAHPPVQPAPAQPQVAGEAVGYNALFNAIAAATKPQVHGVAVEISVSAFTQAIGPLYTTPPATQASNPVA